MKRFMQCGWRRTVAAAGAIAALAAACASSVPQRVIETPPATPAPPPVPAAAPESPPQHAAPQDGVPAAAPADDALHQAFSTRHAHFRPASWAQLPGWREDRLVEAWAAFQRSCGALARKAGWNGPCERAQRVAANSDEAIRQFFEREFALYEIRNTDRTPEGVITGYYEPLVNGSRSRGGPYLYPVYGLPDDLLTLDIRLLPPNLRGKRVAARIEGRSVIPAAGGPYLIDVGDLQPDIRDKKLRVRLEGKRIVPYATRAEIERDGLARARVLVWVDNPAAFYSMQIQGSGKVRLPDGRIVRLGYAEQNGQPFQPPVARDAAAPKKPRAMTRGLAIDLPAPAENEIGMEPDGGERPPTRGLEQPTTPRALPRVREPLSPDVERLIEELAAGRPAGGAAAPAPVFPQPTPEMRAAISADPSYVFFREIPDGPEGPLGALGVPLTAGRSVAVDPRTTPLGYPVFVSTSRPGRKGSLNRLVMAQDAGGAIRGAVRADWFWGFGAGAWLQAARMKEAGRMWLMLPHGQPIAARDKAARTRGPEAGTSDADCVIADPDLCVEDR